MSRRYTTYEDSAQMIQEYVNGYIAENGYSPSVRDIADGIGLSSPGSVYPTIRRMINEGLLRGSPEKSRTIRVGEAVIRPRTETM